MWLSCNMFQLRCLLHNQAVECLRMAFYHAPPLQKDMAALALAHTLRSAGRPVDALTMAQMAIQVRAVLENTPFH